MLVEQIISKWKTNTTEVPNGKKPNTCIILAFQRLTMGK